MRKKSLHFLNILVQPCLMKKCQSVNFLLMFLFVKREAYKKNIRERGKKIMSPKIRATNDLCRWMEENSFHIAFLARSSLTLASLRCVNIYLWYHGMRISFVCMSLDSTSKASTVEDVEFVIRTMEPTRIYFNSFFILHRCRRRCCVKQSLTNRQMKKLLCANHTF